ncbi:MAG: glycosyltransferase family 4 protein [Candidatus Peribacteraceae bacterium]|nr:glycosyltransferase family 4 protein [Candidatus Peribacteraceae bacterium]
MAKILFTRFPLESALGGAEIQTVSLMEGLAKKGHAVAFAGSCHVLLHMCKERGIPAIALDIGPPPVTKWGALSFAWRKKQMLRQLQELLHGFRDLDAVFMLSLTEKLLLTPMLTTPQIPRPRTPVLPYSRIPAFWIEHDRVGRWLTKNPWLPRLRALSRQATTVAVSDLSRKIYLDLGWDPAKTIAIPNGIDLSRFSTEPKSLRSHPEEKQARPSDALTSRPPFSPREKGDRGMRVGCVARLSHEKGVDILIEAVKSLEGVTLSIVGKGHEETMLRDRARENSRIRFLGHVDDLAAFYGSVDALVLPSRNHDPFGLVAAEAMAAGLSVVVTDACGIADYLSDGNDALIAGAGDAAGLRTKIEMLRDPALRHRMGEAARKTAMTRFSVESMVDRYDALLR